MPLCLLQLSCHFTRLFASSRTYHDAGSFVTCLISIYLSSLLELSLGVVVLPFIIGLELGVARFRVAFHLVGVCGLFVVDEDLRDVTALRSGLGEQLTLARVLHRQKQERSFVDRLADRQDTVVSQDGGLVGRAEGFGDLGAFLAGQHDAAVRVVHAVRLVELASVLGEHLDGFAEHAPRLAVDRVCVADGVDVWTSLVDFAVNQKPSGVGRASSVAANDLAVKVDCDHVTCLEEAKVYTEG